MKSTDHTNEIEEIEAADLLLFQVSECYVYLLYMKSRICHCSFKYSSTRKLLDCTGSVAGNIPSRIPPRMSAASYRADEWNVNKWAWEGPLKVISKGEECIIRLEDKATGELYARAYLRSGEPHPVEAVIDSSRYFVLRVEENIGGRVRHAFIGLGFRERTEAYDFQAALHDHMKYLNKKKTAEEMEQQYQHSSSVDYSLKEGETILLQLNKNKSGGGVKSKLLDQGVNTLSLDEKGNRKEAVICIKPPPPPLAPVLPASTNISPVSSPEKSSTEVTLKNEESIQPKGDSKPQTLPETQASQDVPDDDFGDFQAAS